jgi:hypothetical protein
MTELSLPMEYSITGWSLSATATRRMWMLSASNDWRCVKGLMPTLTLGSTAVTGADGGPAARPRADVGSGAENVRLRREVARVCRFAGGLRDGTPSPQAEPGGDQEGAGLGSEHDAGENMALGRMAHATSRPRMPGSSGGQRRAMPSATPPLMMMPVAPPIDMATPRVIRRKGVAGCWPRMSPMTRRRGHQAGGDHQPQDQGGQRRRDDGASSGPAP